MSGDDRRRAPAGEQVGETPDERLTPLVGRREPRRSSDRADPDPIPSPIREAFDDDIDVGDGLVAESLDEILIAMIAQADEETHGTGLMDELARQFDVQLSPGTVYPRLHELEAADLLEVHELVQTKQYSVSDPASAETLVERAAYQHLALGMFLHASLDAL